MLAQLTTSNSCPTGSKHERGILAWNKAHEDDSSNTLESGEVYNLPFGITSYLSSSSWLRYIPFCPPGVPTLLDGSGTDTNALEPKQPLGHPEPSQIITESPCERCARLSMPVWGFSAKLNHQRQLTLDLLLLYCNNMVQSISHELLEWHLQLTLCILLIHGFPLGM